MHLTPSRVYLFCFVVLLGITSTVLLESQAPPGDSTAATYFRGSLHVTIPYQAARAGAGQLTIEVLDPEDKVVGRAQHAVNSTDGKGNWEEQVKLSKAIPPDDLVWHRMHYRFLYADGKSKAIEGMESISQILRTPVVHILGQQTYLTGGPAAVRVVVTDSRNNPIAGASSVRVDLVVPNQKPRTVYTGSLNNRGTTEAQFRFPAGVVGSYTLHYAVDTPIGSTELNQPVRLEDKVSILLTTEKPLYQPGQTIHVRALALDRSNHEAAANRKLTFEVEDSRGNKVFKQATQTDRFGVASAEFALADEVNLGAYHVRALMDAAEAGPSKSAEIALNVERYVLPKFKVAIEFGGKDKKTARGYRPGDHVIGTVRANYFFGKPVDGAEIAVKGMGMDVAQFEVGLVKGKTDAEGVYHFDIQLPRYFAGKPLSQGAARVLIEAAVKDSAGHSETRGEPVTVSEHPFIITAVPEGGTLAPNLENQVFILTSYPDGTPAASDIRVRAAGNADQNVTTDAGGVAVIRVKIGAHAEKLDIEARDKDGNRASSSVRLDVRDGSDQILLRTERAVYRAGDRMVLRVFSTKDRGSAYVDVVKDGQTVVTRDLEIEHGQAELALTAAPELAGTLDINAYLFGSDARPVADHRLVFVQPADELKIEASSDARVYKPGAEARVRFRVTNSKGEGVQAALGLQVVDEAVFALAEKQPGFAKVFFYLEQEVLKPRYEIHSLGMSDIVEPVPLTRMQQRDRAARALFSATEMVNTNGYETEIGRTVSYARYGEYRGRYQSRFHNDVTKLAAALSRACQQNARGGDLVKVMANAKDADIRDAWGTDLRLEKTSWDNRSFTLHSAGPDKRFGTGDDFSTILVLRTDRVASAPTSGTIDLNIEHGRGPFNGRAEIAGTVTDEAGGNVPGAVVTAREIATGARRTATTNASGQFSMAGLTPGEYEVQVSASGFQTAARKASLEVRDRAVLTATLKVGSVSETVVVEDERVRFRDFDGMNGNVRVMNMAGIVRAAKEMPMPMAAPPAGAMDMARADKQPANTVTLVKQEAAATPAAPRVRSYFPEALYINPEIITDASGSASIVIPMADSITTWRMAMMASTTHGALGSATSSLKVFQDFFVDLDLPVTLTQGDRVSIPVAAYNYSGARGDVALKLHPEDWFALVNDNAEKSVAVEAGRVGGAQFTIEAKRIGKYKLTLEANMKGAAGRADIVVREIEVIPNGREQTQVFNGRLDSAVQHDINFPATQIPDASKIFVRLYPGPLSQVVEGMDAILRMPGGCFEQTSSSTYPNVLALDYMKRTKKLTPEVHAKAEGFIANGYQRLLTFEVPGGGFSWFGNPPANKILTSYGLMEFFDMSKVHDVDPKVIERTQAWLAGQQQADGSWKPDTSFINEGATNRYNSDVLRITAYIAWSLGNTGYKGPAVELAKQYVAQHMGGKTDAYTLAVVANFATDYGKDRNFTGQAMQLLLDARTEKDDKVWWNAEETSVYATGSSAAVETTGLAVQALLKWGNASATATKALSYIASKKDASGTWGTTQATIMALRALLLSTEKGAADVRGTLEITLNGKPMEKLVLTADNNELLHQFVFKGSALNGAPKGANEIGLRFNGKGGLAYQIVGQYFVPWNEKPEKEALSIDVAYDRTRLAQDDVATATTTVRNNLTKSANMVMVDIGIPPGFDLLSEDLQAFQEKSAGQKGNRLEKFTMTATQAILYFDSIAPRATVTLHYRLRAKYPIRVRTLQSRVYEYYDPDVNAVARPVQLEVAKR
jgi:hypothetical protein